MINIRKYNPNLLNQPGVLYCGRVSPNDPTQIGLGNPFSHKKNSNAPFQVASLQQSIESYKKWLEKLIKAHCNNQTQSLKSWEKLYLQRVLELAKNIEQGRVTDLMCFCVEFPNYLHKKKARYVCHTQMLYAFCLLINRNKVK